MKIGIIHPDLDMIGGAEKTTFTLLKTLSRTDHKTTLYTTSKIVPNFESIKINRISRWKFPTFWRAQRLIENRKLLSKVANQDLILVMSGGLLVPNINKPCLIYCHSTFDSDLKLVKSKNKGLKKIYESYLQKQILKQFELIQKKSVHLIANSTYTKERLKKNFDKDSIVIYPPVEIKIKDKKIKKGITTLARFSNEKNLEFALKVMSDIETDYNIIGNAKYESQFDVYNNLKKHAKNNNIKIYCNVKRQFIIESLSSSKAYFHTSKETFGISVVEAIAAGCIPIVPDNTANKETVPIDELRYKENDKNDAKKKIESAISGDYDKHLMELQQHIKKFSEEIFQKNIIMYLSKFEKNNNDSFK